jgi:hypothetical protein
MSTVVKAPTLRALFTRARIAGTLMAVAFAGTVMTGCKDSGPRTIDSIVVAPTTVTLAPAGTQQFTMVGTDNDGNSVTNLQPTWAVVAGGGTITQAGLFTAGTTAGTFTNTVSVTCSGHTVFATVIVTPGPLNAITVTPNPSTLAPGATQQFTAVGHDANNNVVAITPVWTVAAGGGTISGTGLFTAGATPGTYTNTVVATSGGKSGSATVIVTPGPLSTITVTPNPATLAPGATQQFTATGTDANGNAVAITPVWSVVAGGGSINAGTGLFTAGPTQGTYTNTVVATSGGKSGSATVIVSAGGLATITVTPNPATVLTNSTQQFVAVGRDGAGNVISITPVWSVVNGGGTINSSTGVFTAGGTTGTFNNTVMATSGATSGNATVIVTNVAPPAPIVNLGAAAPNGIIAGTAVTCITGGFVFADVSISPGSSLSGFGPCVITGTRHLADAPAAQAQIDLTTAYNTLAGLPCPPANAIVADLGGTTKPAGVYCTGSGIGVTGVLTLDGGGDPNATFVFQAGSSLTTAGDIVLINGAQAKNVYWQVGSSATIGTASKWQGNILALTSITLVDNATLLGRALARNGAVTLGTNNVITLP